MLEQEKQLVKEFKRDKVNEASDRSEFEKLFLQCVEEVKKEIKKRKELQVANMQFSNKTVRRNVVKNEFSTDANAPKESLSGDFLPKDKRKVVELLMENDTVLMHLY